MTTDAMPCIIPQPKRATRREGVFRLDADTAILLTPEAGRPEQRAARLLQRELEACTGLSPLILQTARPFRRDNVILLYADRAAAEAYWGERLPRGEDGPGFNGQDPRAAQVHLVDITPRRAIAGGQGAEALRLAVQTLRQLARVEGARWAAWRIVDWPSLAYRGVMMDVSRGKVFALETLREVVDELALYKGNVLQLYTEHTFHFPHHPAIGQGCGALSPDDMLALDAYAEEQGVELQPNLQSFGHCAHILSLPEYAGLAESAACWSLSPSDEGTYRLLDDMYADMLPAFHSEVLNVGCDETYDLGVGRSAEAAKERGLGRVYLEHILRLREIAALYGRRIQLWGDILLHHPELVSEVPDDVTLLDWHYEAAEDYPSVRLFAESGRTFWVCPGTSSWNTIFPRIENSNGNIRTLARLAAEHGAQGLLNTDWGDNGHYQPLGQSWYGYLYGLEQAWSGGATADEAFDPRFGRLFFGAAGDGVVEAIRALGRLNALPGMPLRNASRSVYMLLDDPLVGATIQAVPQTTLVEIERVCAWAEDRFRAALPTTADRLTLEEMIYSARLMAYAARKTIASQRIRNGLAGLWQGRRPVLPFLQGAIETMRGLDAELVALRDTFRELWLRRARYSEIEITLGYLHGLRSRFAAAERWLQARVDEASAGRTPDCDLTAYAQEAESYEYLGMAWRRRFRELGLRG